jgi:hypothetical protein
MAEDHDRPRKEGIWKAPWLKLFTAFKVALDPKKLLLAGLGILATSLGWWFLSMLFYYPRTIPMPEEFFQDSSEVQNEANFEAFKVSRQRWNFLHQLAGPRRSHIPLDLGDLAPRYAEYKTAKKLLDARARLKNQIEITKVDDATFFLKIKDLDTNKEEKFRLVEVNSKEPILKVQKSSMEFVSVLNPADKIILIEGKAFKVSEEEEQFKKIKTLRDKASTDLEQAHEKIQDLAEKDQNRILLIVNEVERRVYKPSGEFRNFPWYEYRGPNQYQVVAHMIENVGRDPQKVVDTGKVETRASAAFLIEPLIKFLKPVVYFFDGRAGGWNRLYLILIILWTLLVWGFFGGAITRMAAVQVARNEKVGFTESLKFAQSRLQSYFAAPLLPLVFLLLLAIFLWFFGLVALGIPILGELVAGLFWPMVLVVGLIMAVVMVGLLGWPLMNATISSEGSDSFDALSRSYSYVYQAPWHYIWYSLVALAYGALVIFFVGFMSSLLVYLGKWGIAQSIYRQDREPAFLFAHAPTSFQWRNLLLQDSPHAEVDKDTPLGFPPQYRLKDDYRNSMTLYNNLGSYLVTFWLALFFLLIVGFGYSYFWTATTIIYLLMRQKVDDTDLDEIHLEEDERDQPFVPEKPSVPPVTTPPASTSPPGTTFTMVDSPSMRPSSPPPPPSQPPLTVAPSPVEPPNVIVPEAPQPPLGNSPPPEEKGPI